MSLTIMVYLNLEKIHTSLHLVVEAEMKSVGLASSVLSTQHHERVFHFIVCVQWQRLTLIVLSGPLGPAVWLGQYDFRCSISTGSC